MSPRREIPARWLEEARHFDAVAEAFAEALRPISPAVVGRYRRPSSLYEKEYAIRLLGDLRGKRVLDVGCGDGENSVLLALLGADVTGIDISPKTVALAERRAALDGVRSRTRFLCTPLETADLPPGGFDVIWAAHVLHHVIPALEAAMARLVACGRPGAQFVALEPVNLSPTLRAIRSLVPVATNGTPGERPLERGELEIIGRHLPGLRMRHFNFAGWFTRFVLGGWQYETSSAARRALADLLAGIDGLVLRQPALARLGGVVVLHARIGGDDQSTSREPVAAPPA